MVPKSLAKWTTASANPMQNRNLDRQPLCRKHASRNPEPRTSARYGCWRAGSSEARSELESSYLACTPSMYVTRLVILCWTCAACPWLMLENSGPQMGMSWLPWEGVMACPLSTAAT